MTDHQISLDRSATAAEGDLRLPNPPGVIRLFWQRHPWLTDSLIAGVYAIPVLLGSIVLTAATDLPVQDLLLALCATASVAAVLFRRRVPLIAFAVALASAALVFSFTGGVFAFGLCAVLYSLPVYDSNRNAWIALGCSVAVIVVVSAFPWPSARFGHPASADVVAYGILMLAAVLIGINIGNRKRYLRALIDRAAQLVRERDQQAQLASAAERARIAREMHDIVSHSLTVMVSLADGSVAVIGSEPERSRDAMLQVAETGRQALTDMRRMLGVLREATGDEADVTDGGEAAERTPQPAASDLSALIDRFRLAGLPVRYTVRGVAPDDPGLQLTVYRVVQEALTNVLRHAGTTARVGVEIRYDGPMSIAVTNSAPPASSTVVAIPGAGRGLIGLRERVAVYGGTLEAGPALDGWRVLAVITSPETDANR